jgi:hypothetical protein
MKENTFSDTALYVLKNLEKFRIVEVRFSSNGRTYSYLAGWDEYKKGDLVLVPCGDDFKVTPVVNVRAIRPGGLKVPYEFKWVNCKVVPTQHEKAIQVIGEKRERYELQEMQQDAAKLLSAWSVA